MSLLRIEDSQRQDYIYSSYYIFPHFSKIRRVQSFTPGFLSSRRVVYALTILTQVGLDQMRTGSSPRTTLHGIGSISLTDAVITLWVHLHSSTLQAFMHRPSAPILYDIHIYAIPDSEFTHTSSIWM